MKSFSIQLKLNINYLHIVADSLLAKALNIVTIIAVVLETIYA